MATEPVTVDWNQVSTERAVMAAALRLFSQKGFHGVGIRDIAREAGISTAALYHYMTTKEELLKALMTDRLVRILNAAELACEGLASPDQELASTVRVHVIAHARFPSHIVDDEVRSLSGTARRAIIELRDKYEEFWHGILSRGVSQGIFDIKNVRFSRLALLEMCNGVNRWFSTSGAASAEQVADAFADLSLALVRASRSGRPLRLSDLSLPPIDHYAAIVDRTYEGVEEG